MVKTIKQYIKEHKFLTITMILSFIISILILCIKVKLYLFSIIPFVIICTFCFIETKTMKKFPLITKIIGSLLNIAFILAQILLYLVLFSYSSLFSYTPTYENPKDYKKAIKRIWVKECIIHFPTGIPKNAKNVLMEQNTNNFFGSESFYLQFDIDKEYIEKELEKYNFISKTKYSEYKNNHMIIWHNLDDSYIFYLIGDRDTENKGLSSFPYHYGIATNEEKNSVLYYYENPD